MAYGADLEETESEQIASVECYRCERDTPREEDWCMWCEQMLTPAAIENIQQDEGEIRRAVLDLVRN